MMKFFANISTKAPWLVILVVFGITGLMLNQIATKLKIEPDMTKFMPNSMPTTKANDYYKKNFNSQDVLLIGMEATQGSLLTPTRLRAMEKIIVTMSGLTTQKTFESLLTGKTETLTFGLGIDVENIAGLANLENIVLDPETGSVSTGSVIKKLKAQLGIPSKPGEEERLPQDDADLERLIPLLNAAVLENRLFVNNVLSVDQKAALIRVPMVRKWDYKRRFTLVELTAALDPANLKARYNGKDTLFPFTIYGKTLGDVTYDDEFIAEHSVKMSEVVGSYLDSKLSPLYGDYPELKNLLSGPLTVESFNAVMRILDQREFNLHPEMMTWENVTNGLWELTLANIDPASRENLEFKLGNVVDIFDLALVYNLTNEILARSELDGVKYHIAGTPVVMAKFSEMIGKDIGMLLPIGVVVIFFVLAFSFRSVRGVVIPLLTVILSIVWALGSMAITGTPLTGMSSILPIVLLATGSAYGIHLLNRYYDDIKLSTHRKEVMSQAVQHVGWAIVMAATTTFAGFMSLLSSDLSIIGDFGLFAACGVAYALFLTLTLSPALLSLWPLPKKLVKMHETKGQHKENWVDRGLQNMALWVTANAKKVVVGSGVLIIGFATVVPQLEFEGGQMDNFKPSNTLFQSDLFLNKHLTGTNLFNLLFKFREYPNLKGQWITKELTKRTDVFRKHWTELTTSEAVLLTGALSGLEKAVAAKDAKHITVSLQLFADLQNEDFEVDLPESATSAPEESSLDMLDDSGDDLSGLGDFADEAVVEEDIQGPFSELSTTQIEGLKDLTHRLGQPGETWMTTGVQVLKLREALKKDQWTAYRYAFNRLSDLFATDVKQPQVLAKLEQLQAQVSALQSPAIELGGKQMSPTGMVSGPVDLIRLTYRVFFHDDNPAFERLPNAETDGLSDASMTDRGIIGVVLNQAQSGSRETFDAMISPDLKEFQLNIIARDGMTSFVLEYQEQLKGMVDTLFPEDDPYIEKVTLAGYAPSITELTSVIASSQLKSIGLAFALVFGVTFFIFGSTVGGIYSIIPLLFTVLGNFAAMWALGWKINTGTMLVASISIGIGVDYTIHFLERFKHQVSVGDDIETAYLNTTRGIGKAVLINATSVALGFLVLMLSDFVSNITMGFLMAGTMIYSSIGAMVILPALIVWTRPKFISKHTMFDEDQDEENQSATVTS